MNTNPGNLAVLCAILMIALVSSCNNKDLAKEKECEYKDSVLINTYASQLDSINMILTEAGQTNTDLFNSGDTSKSHVIERIKQMCLKIEQSDLILKNLQAQLDSTDIQGNLIVKKTYEEKSNELERTKRYYKQLLEQLEKVQGENINLKELLSQHDSEQHKKDLLIAELNKIVTQKEEEIQNKDKEINSMTDDLNTIANMSSYKESRIHYEAGERYLKEFEAMKKGMKGIITKKGEKEKKLQMAYDSFAKAREMGHPDAKRKMYVIEYNYSNYMAEAKTTTE